MIKKYKKALRGFTLVELLIVIALIAILSVAVLAAINPIEQANKARDSRVQNDAAEILNAYERYYASLQRYPWQDFTDAVEADDEAFYRSDTMGFGICNGTGADPVGSASTDTATACSASDAYPNLLISTSELKSSFAGKDEFEPVRGGTHEEQALWTVKAANDNSIYVCYIPKANANRVDTTKLRCVEDLAGAVAVTTYNGAAGTCGSAAVADWGTPTFDTTTAMFRCVPE